MDNMVDKIFESYDKNNTGVLEEKELKHLFKDIMFSSEINNKKD